MMKKSCMVGSLILALNSVSTAFAAPYSFMEAAPLNPGRVRPGETPRQFLFTLFDSKYICEKTNGRDIEPQGPATNDETINIMCDGESRLLIRHGSRTTTSSAFNSSYSCQEAIKQFKANGACICDSSSAISCYEKGKGFSRIGAPFFSSFQCTDALKTFSAQYEIRAKD